MNINIDRAMWSIEDFPKTIEDTAGLGYKDDKYFTDIRRRGIREGSPRRVTVEITSWAGISAGAMHYYGRMMADGVNFRYINKPNVTTTPWDIIGSNPLYKFSYDFELKRPVTEEEIKEGTRYKNDRWEGYRLGDYTNAFNEVQDIIDVAIPCFKNRFIGNWELWIDDKALRYREYKLDI